MDHRDWEQVCQIYRETCAVFGETPDPWQVEDFAEAYFRTFERLHKRDNDV